MLFHYYKIINVINDKTYIGITEKKPEERWRQHKKLLQKNEHPNYKMQKEWNEYGEDNFRFELIESLDCETIEIGYQHEYDLIQGFDGVKYNILVGGQINPMYTKSVREKMIATKQNAVPNILQLEEIEENVFKVIGKFNSQKEAGRLSSADQGNIQQAITKRTKGCGYYWIEETSKEDFESNWKPTRTKPTYCAQLDNDGNIVEVHYNYATFQKKYGWSGSCIANAIKRNGKTFGIKFIRITEEEYYKLKPITLIY